ncbi:MAG: PAS domain S-box protein [Desulfobacterales bacterium]|nr:PAS domain S-box protein [Desulfobacterales bacterium]
MADFTKKNVIQHYSRLTTALVIACIIIGLYLTTLHHYLLFHGIAEIFSISIAGAVFMISWNTREHTENYYLVYLGIAYLFIGITDLFHTLSYKGMNIFTDYDFYANQLWIGARYMESLTFLAFFILAGRKTKIPYSFVILFYAVLTGLILASVFLWKIFPICFVAGKGLTLFKKISEYIICCILILSLAALHKNRDRFDPYIRKLLMWTILLTIGGELAFTFYISNYGFSNLVGHYLKIASFYLVYKAIIETGLRNPFNLIFKQLKDSEQRYKNLFNTALVGIIRTKPDGSEVLAANPAGAEIFAYESADVFISKFVPRDRYVIPGNRDQLIQQLEDKGRVEWFEFLARDQKGKERHLALNAVMYSDYIEEAILDITEQVENRRKIQEATEQDALQRGKLEMAGSVLHDIGNAVTGLGTTVTRLVGEEWPETLELGKLEKMVEQKREKFAEALGQGKEEALITFVRQLKSSLEDHSGQLRLDYQTMAKTVTHVNEILHLQRRYARDGQAGRRVPVNLAEVAEDALAMYAGGFEKRRVSVHRRISPDLPRISGDQTKLIRVFLNLFKNICEAFDTVDRNEDRVLEILAESSDDGKIRLILSDNASGFEPEVAESLFVPGFSTKDRNSGMGLCQCRDIVESHRGTIRLESPGKNQGTKIIIELSAQSD